MPPMLFHSSVRKELARSFAATLVVLVTIVMTMTLVRTLGDASRGTFDPSDVLIIMGYTVLSDLPILLAMCLFIAVLSVLSRMFRDSEMVIWFGSGYGLASLLHPLVRFSWPILLVILTLAFFILPWAYSRIEDLRHKYEQRGDIARIEPGKFQESATGDRVFFIEKDDSGKHVGNNVFIATTEPDKETITSARTGRVEVLDSNKFLILENGQRLEKTLRKDEMTISVFERYGARVGTDDRAQSNFVPTASMSSVDLLMTPTPRNLAELSWRLGLTLAAFNFVLIGLAVAGVNPRVGRAGNIGVGFLAFVIYFNLLVLGKSWIAAERVTFAAFLLILHGGMFALGALWLAKRHNQWTFFRAFGR